MSNEKRKEYTEILEILENIDEKDRIKIPPKMIDFFQENKDNNYKFELDLNKDLSEQNLMKETIILLAIINLNYFCTSLEEKKKWIKIYSNNEKKYQEYITQNYKSEDIFKNIDTKNIINSHEFENKNVAIVKENIFKKILRKFKNMFANYKSI